MAELCMCAHIKAPPMGEGASNSCSLSSRSAVTIVSACVARSRSVAFPISTRACNARLTVRIAASRDNFGVCVAAIIRE